MRLHAIISIYTRRLQEKTVAHLIDLTTHTNQRGSLTVIERVIPFGIKRIFWIYGVDDSRRGGHRHAKTVQAAVCIQGSCIIENNDGTRRESFALDRPSRCLVLEPQDWHVMHSFSRDAILMVVASEYYDPEDYIYEPYED